MLKLGKGMSTVSTATDVWGDLSDGAISYLKDYVPDHYEFSDNQKTIYFVEKTSTQALALKGVASTPTTPKNGVVTLKAANFEECG